MTRTWIIAAIVGPAWVFGGLYALGVCLGMAGAPTWKVGYYGKFNRVRATIAGMPEVRIVDAWQHHDVTLEDFGFSVTAEAGRRAKVDFLEGSPQMRLTEPGEVESFVRASLTAPR